MCYYPKFIENPKYRPNKKNGGVIPPITDERVKMVPIGCGKCMECLRGKARNWNVRLQEELKGTKPKHAKFITLTFSNESLKELENDLWIKVKHSTRKEITMKNGKKRKYYNYMEVKNPHELKGYDLDNAIGKLGTRRFLERWRKKFGKSVKHWLVSELGTKKTERLHLHGILFLEDPNQIDELEKLWNYGHVFVGEYVNESTMSYITKYVSKPDKLHRTYKPIILTSSGIGSTYIERPNSALNRFDGENTREYYRTRTRHKLTLPIYYRNLLYTDEEKEKLWIIKLDRKERFVNGVRIDISKTDEHYYKKLEMARMENERYKFGDDKANWKLKQYEQWRRKLKHVEQRVFSPS